MVDCVIGGSPCQDLSVAGKRAGLAGERSGLYMEQIRIIKEMRHHDVLRGRANESVRPRYMVWENVPGAFSSNQGKDFSAVLEEAIRVAEPEAPDVPVPEKGWPTSGCIVGDCWSVAWRVLDAQFWGVPQRRRRICLVADFNGLNAPKIVFGEAEYNGSTEQAGRKSPIGYSGKKPQSEVQPFAKGLSGDLDKSEQKGEAVAGEVKSRSGTDDRTRSAGFPLGFRPENVRCYDEVATTLCNGTRPGFTTGIIQPIAFDTYNMDVPGDKTVTLRAGAEHNYAPVFQPVPMVMEQIPFCKGKRAQTADDVTTWKHCDVTNTLNSFDVGEARANEVVVAPVIAVDQGGGKSGANSYEGVSPTLTCTHGGEPAVVYGISPYHSNCMLSDNPHSGYYEADTARTLDALQCGYPGCNQGGMAVVEPAYSIGNGQVNQSISKEVAGSLNCMHDQQAVIQPVGTFQETGIGWWNDEDVGATLRALSGGDAMKANLVVAGVDCRNATEYEEQTGSLQFSACHNLNSNNVVRVRYIVRRLTPLECERLQGYPDGWTDIGEWVDSKGKKHKEADSPRYKALGNSIAIPPWKWVLKRLCAFYERDATMASLFDGIGGFPYIWEQLNGKGSCLWASEIEEFPMAVTKLRFADGNIKISNQPKVETAKQEKVLWIDGMGDFKCPVCGGVSEYVTKHCPECGEKLVFGGDDNV